MLVLLRIAVGWHFLYEGLWKYEHPEFSAEGFLRQAKGPFARWYHNLIPDYDGTARLDMAKTVEAWKAYSDRFAEHFNLSDEQTAEAAKVLQRGEQKLQLFYDEIKEDLADYHYELQRHRRSLRDPITEDVPFAQKRYHEKEQELQRKLGGWAVEIERLEGEFRQELAGLVDDDQRARKGPLIDPPTQLDRVDQLTTYGLMAIGAGLILGLLTRVWCLAGAVFLASVLLAQPAWPAIFPPAHPSAGHSLVITKEFLEMLILLTLMATPVGRWGGLDFFIHHLLFRGRSGKET
jgi:uncharacterized membrane protein YphA (DoxX/SURF4 family)